MFGQKKRVFVGLSGGVDSAVSAALLQKDGCEVTGVFIRIVVPGYPCTAGQDKVDAMRVAAHLRIPFLEIDLSEAYKKKVFDESIKAFAAGRTPNPDTLCNKEIKFGLFYTFATSQGADFVATGHYAQIKDGLLYTGVDKEKDQSYFLWQISQEILRRTLFPVGHLQKNEVRALAERLGLPNARRKDSQGLCFLGPVSTNEMLQRELHPLPGDVLDEKGNAVGTHHGAALYTLGQRRGFELFARSSDTLAHYVVARDIEKNTITVSADKFPQDAKQTEIILLECNWIGEVRDDSYVARYRYRQLLIPADILEKNKVLLQEPHYAPEGQSLVLYQGERCLGGGVIEKVTIY